jgi:uncharacterized protein YydD (DUF2326 family)
MRKKERKKERSGLRKATWLKIKNFVLFDHVADGFWLAKGNLLLLLLFQF